MFNKIKVKLLLLFHIILRPSGKYSFLNTIKPGVEVLDVGAGKSPNRIKRIFPNLTYVGIDIDDHFKNKKNMADKYILTTIDDFEKTLKKQSNKFYCTISSHNLEHCENRVLVLKHTLDTVKSGGFIYLSFPSEITVNFDKGRSGTLNYFDDDTHKELPPNFQDTLQSIKSANFTIVKTKVSYKPIILYLIGLILEPISKISKKVMPGTLQYWGFETIIIAKKN